MKAAVRKGFTLIEILIVVIILGILAAIVIPQFSTASEEAKAGAAQTAQASLRAQIQLWKLQHNDTYPTLDQLQAGWTVLTMKTAADPTSTPAATGAFGPYLQSVPVNQINNSSTVAAVTVAPGAEPTSAALTTAATSGWIYDVNTGRIWATTNKTLP